MSHRLYLNDPATAKDQMTGKGVIDNLFGRKLEMTAGFDIHWVFRISSSLFNIQQMSTKADFEHLGPFISM